MATALQLEIGGVQRALALRGLRRAFHLREVTLRVGDKTMPALVRGSGAPIVLVHGFGADKESWLTLIGAFDRRRAVVALDLPGFGAASKIAPAEASPRRQANAVLGAMSQLGIDRAHLVGSSMGGGISQVIALHNPERVLSLTLLGSAGMVGNKSELGRELEKGNNPLLATSPEDFLRLVEWMTVRRPYLPRGMMLHQGRERMQRAEAESKLFEGFVHAPADERMPTEPELVKTPTLVIHGDKDVVIDVSTGRELARRMPNAELVVMGDIGHLPHLEATREVAASIDAFATRHDPPVYGA